MDVDRVEGRCEQCGRPLPQSRHGGQRKRFCDATCRGRWHRGQPKNVTPLRRRAPAEAGPHTHAGRVATLEWLRGELERDIRARGAVVDGRPHPAIETLRRITADISRMVPAAEEAEAPVVVDLHSV